MKHVINTSILKIFSVLCVIIIFSVIFSCKTVVIDEKIEAYRDFLKEDPAADEVFRVLILSDRYESSQMKFQEKISRIEDIEGDKIISDKLKEYDKINEVCDGVLTVSLYHNGKIMKIRPKEIASIAEVNSLIVDDLKRWSFNYVPENTEPSTFNIKYRVILRKIQSDEDIMKEVIERAKKEEEKKKNNID